MDTSKKFSPITIGLHWFVGLAMIGLSLVGLYMANTQTYALYDIHKSLGILALVVILLRVFWRFKNGWPRPLEGMKPWEQQLSHATHGLLLAGTVLMPISGMMYSGFSGHGFGIFGLTVVPTQYDALDPSLVVPYHEGLGMVSKVLHSWSGYIVSAAIVLHIVGAFKHHWLSKDGTLKRMLGQSIG